MTSTPDDGPSFPKRRAQAARNRERILTVARAAFADPDPDTDADVSMAEIARRADIGMATLYRNFGSRRELLEALFHSEIDSICELADTVEGPTAGARFETWLRHCREALGTKHHLAELLAQTDADDLPHSANRERVLASGRPLLVAAQRSGDIRDDLSLEQVVHLVTAITAIRGDPDYVEPILRAALDGLRTRPSPAPSAADD